MFHFFQFRAFGRRMLLLLGSVWMLCCLSGWKVREQKPDAAWIPDSENRLVVYTSHKEDVVFPLVQEFEWRTGIWVTVEYGGTNELLSRVEAEGRETACDVLFGGGVESLEGYSALFEEESGLYGEGTQSWGTFSSLPIVLIYNPGLAGDAPPNGWQDLLDSRWRGSIAFASPEISGSCYTALATMLQTLPLTEEELLSRFVQNLNRKVLDSSGDVVDAVAEGRCAVGVTLEETALKAMAAGKNIAMTYPQEGTSAVPDGIAILKNSQHRSNAEQFVRFVLGEEVQSRLAERFSRRPAHGDSTAFEARQFRLADYDIVWASAQRTSLLARWNRLMEGKE